MLLNFSKESSKIFGVATDGHRLAYSLCENSSITQSQKVTIPRKIVLEIKKVLDSEEGDITIDISPSKLTFNFTKMNFFRTIPFVIIIILALLVMLIAGGIGLIATGFMNVAIWLDQEAGNIRDGK